MLHIQRKRIEEFLSKFDAVSVREELFRGKIKKIAGKNAILLVDPVFLLEQSEWDNICNPIEEDTDYILLYMMQPDKSVHELARKIKKETGKKIIEISRYGFKREFVDRIYIDVGPKEFIGLLRNARYVCTNSYHGIVFSLIFGKDLYLIKCRRFQERLNTLNKIFGLSDPDHNYLHRVIYDKQYVKNMLQKERKKAYCYLKENLTEKYD